MIYDMHPSSDNDPTTRTPTPAAFLSAFTGMHGNTTPAVGQRQPTSPEPGPDRTRPPSDNHHSQEQESRSA